MSRLITIYLSLCTTCYFCLPDLCSGQQKKQDTDYLHLFSNAFSEAKFEEAADYSEKMYEDALKRNDQDGIYTSLTTMFTLNRQIGNYEKSFIYAQKLYEIAVTTGNTSWVGSALWNLAEVYIIIGDYPTALDYYRRARALHNIKLLDYRVYEGEKIRFELGFAELFSLMNQFDSAWHYYQADPPSGELSGRLYLTSIGEYYFLKGNFSQALENFQLGLTQHQKRIDVNEVMRSWLDLAKVHLVLGHPQDALYYGRQILSIAFQARANQDIRDGYKIVSDAWGLLGRTDSSNYYFRKYTVVKDAVANDLVKGKFAIYNYQQRIENANKDKHIQEIRLQKQRLIRDQLIAGILLTLLIAIVIVWNIILKRRNEANQRELAEMKAIRAQMSPHFIFNCLNSINQFIIRNNAETAAGYLTKFAKLIRMILEKSGNSFIPLEEELACLRLYMDLEAVRFERPFVYEIRGPGVDEGLVMIPSLLIQPFVENAIWHGLHPNEGCQGKITIILRIENNYLHCEIADNGIGLKRSAALRQSGETEKRSMGVELTMQRLQLANPLHRSEKNSAVTYRSNETGENAGTCVHIKIPIKYNETD